MSRYGLLPVYDIYKDGKFYGHDIKSSLKEVRNYSPLKRFDSNIDQLECFYRNTDDYEGNGIK